MKKFLISCLLAVSALGASAQGGIKWGVQAFGGLNSINEDGAKAALSWGAGVVAEYPLSETLYIGSGLNFQNKAWKFDYSGSDTYNVYYLTLPVHLGSMADLGGTTFFYQGGVQLGYGISGSKVYGIEYKDWGKRFEFGVGAQAGLVFAENYCVNLMVNYGLTECQDNGGHNLDVNLGVAYMF